MKKLILILAVCAMAVLVKPSSSDAVCYRCFSGAGSAACTPGDYEGHWGAAQWCQAYYKDGFWRCNMFGAC